MSAPNNGGPAFPVSMKAWDRVQGIGMSLRDYFAGQALAALISNESRLMVISQGLKSPEDIDLAFAISSYKIADAMILEREMVKGKKI